MKRAPIKQILRNEKGSTIIEFAIVAPIFFLLMMGIIEFGLYMMTSIALESAVGQAGRVASLNAGAGDVASRVMTTIRQKTASFPRPSTVDVRAELVRNNSTGGTTKPDYCLENGPNGIPTTPSTCPSGVPYIDNNGNSKYDSVGSLSMGAPGDLVEIRASYPWKVYFPILNQFFTATSKNSAGQDEVVSGLVIISATTVVRNEPAAN